ncbi:hypothetical protein GmHk_12G034524 [Glycine max]|nr:hypothetical protein GmHk_12G034524 [Glycine max]
MRGKSTIVPIDLEIEATCRCNNAARRQREQDIDTSPPLSPNHVQMDGEPVQINYMGNPNRQGFQGYYQGNPSGYNNGLPRFNQGRNFNRGSGWRNQGNQYKELRPQPPYQHPSHGPSQQEKPSLSIEEMILSFTQETRAFIQETRANTQKTKAFSQETRAFIQETRSHQKSTYAAIRNLETQLGQLA